MPKRLNLTAALFYIAFGISPVSAQECPNPLPADPSAAQVIECLRDLQTKVQVSEPVSAQDTNIQTEPIDFVRPPQFGAGWSTYGGFRNFEYAKDNEGMVRLRGMMQGCASRDIAIFVLPEGFRPSTRLILSTIGGTGNDRARVDITSDGNIYFWYTANKNPCPAPNGTGPQWLTLEGLAFEAEQ